MADRPKLAEALDMVMELTYPPTTLSIDTAKAAGHRLAKAVVAKGNLPTRPVALTDGLAVVASDVVAARAPRQPSSSDDPGPPREGEAETESGAPEPVSGPLEPVDEADPLSETAPDAASVLERLDEGPGEPETADTVRLELRPFPPTNRLEDALVSGQAIAVPAGGEVPRGGELIHPFHEFIAEGENAAGDAQSEAAAGEVPAAESGDNGADNDENGDLPVAEPARDWDLVARHQRGQIELARLPERPPANMVGIGAWARSREVLLPERTILRASDVALLISLGIDEVMIYRRPVVGVASLGPLFPVAGRQPGEEAENGVCPLSALVVYLARAARVAALPLGMAPLQFRRLASAVEKWTRQVDILLLIGGSHHGPRCLGRDVLSSVGKVQVSGVELRPGGSISTGKVNGQPVVVMPGSLPDVLVGFVLLARPLAHKYLTPHLFEDQLQLELANGSYLGVRQDTAVPVRYSFDHQRGVYYTRFNGAVQEPWLDYSRGQALVVLEAGRQYADGETVTAWRY